MLVLARRPALRLPPPISFAQVTGDDDADALYRSLVRRSEQLLADVADEVAQGVDTLRQARRLRDRTIELIPQGFLSPLGEAFGDALFAADIAARVRVGQRADRLGFAAHPAFPAPAEAVEFLLSKKLMPWSEMEGALADYRTRAFWMARVEELRVLGTVRDKLREALEAGVTEEGFVAAIGDAFTGEFTAARLRTVYRTNLQSAYQAGNYVQLTHPDVADLFPFYEYWTVDDDRRRPTHAAMHGKRFRRSHRIWKSWWPPNGYNCRCQVIALDEATVEELGLKRSDRWPEVSPGAGAAQPDSNFAGLPTDFDWKAHALEAEKEARKQAKAKQTPPRGPASRPAWEPMRDLSEAESKIGMLVTREPEVSKKQALEVANVVGAEREKLLARFAQLRQVDVPELRVVKSELRGALGEWDGSTGQLRIKSGSASKKARATAARRAKQARRTSTVVDAESIFRHELGHAAQEQLLTEAESFMMRDEFLDADEVALARELSKYALIHPDEAFAEMFSLMASGRKTDFSVLPSTQKAIARILGL